MTYVATGYLRTGFNPELGMADTGRKSRPDGNDPVSRLSIVAPEVVRACGIAWASSHFLPPKFLPRKQTRRAQFAQQQKISVSAGKPFGLQRVCQALEFPRSTIYAVRAKASTNATPMVPRRRGPKPKMPDADLLKAASLCIGEGHRKVWARLRIVHESACPGPAYCG
jgi:hypothetical protein